LIVPTVGFVYEYAKNQQLESGIVKTNVELNELRSNVTVLQAQVTQLREKLRISNYATIGLTFLWSSNLTIDRTAISEVVKSMNEEIWDQFHIYFFIYHASSESFVPETVPWDQEYWVACFSSGWCGKAWNLYPERDIPIGIFSSVGPYNVAGWEVDTNQEHFIVTRMEYLHDSSFEGRIISHELLHVFGFSDQDLAGGTHFLYDSADIPPDWSQRWSERIQSSAKWFQMPMPDE
jgi:hypothetical protein